MPCCFPQINAGMQRSIERSRCFNFCTLRRQKKGRGKNGRAFFISQIGFLPAAHFFSWLLTQFSHLQQSPVVGGITRRQKSMGPFLEVISQREREEGMKHFSVVCSKGEFECRSGGEWIQGIKNVYGFTLSLVNAFYGALYRGVNA